MNIFLHQRAQKFACTGEARFLYEEAAPVQPEVEQVKKMQENLTGLLENIDTANADALRGIQDAKIADAEADVSKVHDQILKAVAKAATLETEYLRGQGITPEEAQTEVKEKFALNKFTVTFDATGKASVGEGSGHTPPLAPEKTNEQKLQDATRESPDDLKKSVTDAYNIAKQDPTALKAFMEIVGDVLDESKGKALSDVVKVLAKLSFEEQIFMFKNASNVLNDKKVIDTFPVAMKRAGLAMKAMNEDQLRMLGALGEKFEQSAKEQKDADKNISEEDKKKIEEEANKALKDVDLSKISDVEKQIQTGLVMMQHGVNVVEEGGKLVAKAPNTNFDQFINRFMGLLIWASGLYEKIKGGVQKATEKNNTKPKTIEERVAQLNANQKKTSFTFELQQREEDKKQVKDLKIGSKDGGVFSDEVVAEFAALGSEVTADGKAVLFKNIDDAALAKIEEMIAKANGPSEDEKKEQEKIASIPKDGKWHTKDEVKNGADGWVYKIASDGRAYANKGNQVGVFSKDKWVDVAEDAHITDGGEAAKYRQTFMKGGDAAWATIDAGKPNWQYSINIKTGTLYTKKGDEYQQYEYALNKWTVTPKYEPGPKA